MAERRTLGRGSERMVRINLSRQRGENRRNYEYVGRERENERMKDTEGKIRKWSRK